MSTHTILAYDPADFPLGYDPVANIEPATDSEPLRGYTIIAQDVEEDEMWRFWTAWQRYGTSPNAVPLINDMVGRRFVQYYGEGA